MTTLTPEREAEIRKLNEAELDFLAVVNCQETIDIQDLLAEIDRLRFLQDGETDWHLIARTQAQEIIELEKERDALRAENAELKKDHAQLEKAIEALEELESLSFCGECKKINMPIANAVWAKIEEIESVLDE